MQLIHSWKFRIIAGLAALGAVYGLGAALTFGGSDVSPWGITIPVVTAAALFASAGSALCRTFETCFLIRESQKRPSNHTLCYRGVRISSLLENTHAEEVEVESESPRDGLCYRGVHAKRK